MKLLKKDEEIIRKDAYTFQTDDGKYLFYNRYIDRFDKVIDVTLFDEFMIIVDDQDLIDEVEVMVLKHDA